jgi:hypothetical protein
VIPIILLQKIKSIALVRVPLTQLLRPVFADIPDCVTRASADSKPYLGCIASNILLGFSSFSFFSEARVGG